MSEPAYLSLVQAPLMGLDIGTRRIGVALSNPLGIAQPLLTLVRTNPRKDVRSLARLIRRYECTTVIAGNPLHLSGEPSAQTKKVHAFLDLLRAEVGVPIVLWDERLTTVEAHTILDASGHDPRDRKRIVDQVAAVLILQEYLDAHAQAAPTASPDEP